MAKIDVISGFLGAGKTTLIRKLLEEALQGEQIVLIENEFGEIGIDGGFLKDAGINITEMNSGCICCSLVGDFGVALKKVVTEYHPDRVIIEPSGVGKLSDVMAAVNRVSEECELELNSAATVADASKCKVYMKNFGEFYDNQIENAGTIVLSRTQLISEEKLAEAVALLRTKNPKARIITTPWDELDGKKILAALEDSEDLTKELMALAAKQHELESLDGTVTCPECGRPILLGSKFCPNCGATAPVPAAPPVSAPVQPICPFCGQPVAPDAAFCAGCGNKLPEQPANNGEVNPNPAPVSNVCPNCGEVLAPDALFCAVCGTKAPGVD